MSNSKIIGIGAYAPENIVTNKMLQSLVDTSDEWIKTRTGIEKRSITIDEETSDLAVKASKIAIKNAKISAKDIDMIIVATITPDTFTPSTACVVQKKLEAINACAFDINAACTGFIYGLKVADSFIRSGEFKNILIIGAETLSKVLNWNDRGTCVLFGDGAGAVVVTATNNEGIKAIEIKSDGNKGDVLTIGGAPLNNPFNKNEKILEQYIKMNGREVFKFATKAMEESILNVLERSNSSLDKIKHIIPHQANLRIIDYVSKKLNIASDKFIINLDKYGNTSSASIPIALYEAYKQKKITFGDEVILVGFGGGLTWGSALIKL
ncbi:beta-ketoacyl-ACP synthase III [Clostridium tarantellae]|uniref:Beta-ketoacyl-[acyl-carrier-protein] synthase III n=1 Tax=Clostridium tarantellae TaxID=39493 RepID=A0A6I1MP51_9CLOT|nr:beta-ketoacyl-ACP synthase III [Clostridium tarantellae]MPQ43897.1 beta-ketoacyl-ACP synthase III [Clostridium tarantellae]